MFVIFNSNAFPNLYSPVTFSGILWSRFRVVWGSNLSSPGSTGLNVNTFFLISSQLAAKNYVHGTFFGVAFMREQKLRWKLIAFFFDVLRTLTRWYLLEISWELIRSPCGFWHMLWIIGPRDSWKHFFRNMR